MPLRCPSCNYVNKDTAARVCNLCGAILAPKPSPSPRPVPGIPATPPAAMASPQAESAAGRCDVRTAPAGIGATGYSAGPRSAPTAAPVAATPDVSAQDLRVASWPNRSVLCFLFVPTVALLISPLLLHAEPNQDEMVRENQWDKFLCLAADAAICLTATAPLAARLVVSPYVASGACVAVIVVAALFNPAMGSGLFWIPAFGAAMVWYGRRQFDRRWDARQFARWALRGYARLLAPDRFAILRIVGGLVLFLGGIACILAGGFWLFRETGVRSRAWVKLLAVPSFLGAALVASGLSLSEDGPSAPGTVARQRVNEIAGRKEVARK